MQVNIHFILIENKKIAVMIIFNLLKIKSKIYHEIQLSSGYFWNRWVRLPCTSSPAARGTTSKDFTVMGHSHGKVSLWNEKLPDIKGNNWLYDFLGGFGSQGVFGLLENPP